VKIDDTDCKFSLRKFVVNIKILKNDRNKLLFVKELQTGRSWLRYPMR
jgi:hypothetical protein